MWSMNVVRLGKRVNWVAWPSGHLVSVMKATCFEMYAMQCYLSLKFFLPEKVLIMPCITSYQSRTTIRLSKTSSLRLPKDEIY